jgi:hypothetical protein
MAGAVQAGHADRPDEPTAGKPDGSLVLREEARYSYRAVTNLYQVAVGEDLCRRFCLIIVRARQGVLIENVPFGRQDKLGLG